MARETPEDKLDNLYDAIGEKVNKFFDGVSPDGLQDPFPCSECGERHTVSESCTIPDAPMYVQARNKFFSGQDLFSGKTSKDVVPVANRAEANKVKTLWDAEDGYDYVTITRTKPSKTNPNHHYRVTWAPRQRVTGDLES